jgi:hypothetical protein
MYEKDWAIEDPLNLATWRVIREAKQSKKDNGRVSALLRQNLIQVIMSHNPEADQEALRRTSTNELYDIAHRHYSELSETDVPKIQKAIEKTLGYLKEAKPSAYATIYRQLNKAAEKSGVEFSGIPEDCSLKEPLEFLAALEEVVEKIQRGESISEADMPDALKPEQLAKNLTDLVIEADYMVNKRTSENEGYKKSIEDMNTKLMKKKRPQEIVQQYGRKLQELNMEKITKSPKEMSKVIRTFKNEFGKTTGNSAYSLMDQVGDLYTTLAQRELLERDYQPVTTLESLV